VQRFRLSGLIHKDIKPANVLVNSATGQCWLMGFGIASRLRRERQVPEPPEFTHLRTGKLLWAHIAPEKREEVVFEIVHQLNRGAALVSSGDERERTWSTEPP
jgi:serine/threonine protein kinase